MCDCGVLCYGDVCGYVWLYGVCVVVKGLWLGICSMCSGSCLELTSV